MRFTSCLFKPILTIFGVRYYTDRHCPFLRPWSTLFWTPAPQAPLRPLFPTLNVWRKKIKCLPQSPTHTKRRLNILMQFRQLHYYFSISSRTCQRKYKSYTYIPKVFSGGEHLFCLCLTLAPNRATLLVQRQPLTPPFWVPDRTCRWWSCRSCCTRCSSSSASSWPAWSAQGSTPGVPTPSANLAAYCSNGTSLPVPNLYWLEVYHSRWPSVAPDVA